MSIVKSFSVGDGDMFYIKHGSDNFTMIDCCITQGRDWLIDELIQHAEGKNIKRFISTHPDDDHIRGLRALDDAMPILNFYTVANRSRKVDVTDDFRRYCDLRDSDKAFS